MVELKKIQTMMVGIMFLLLGIATSCSDGDEAILPEQASAKMPATEGVIETSILPISNEFYTQKRF